MQGKRYWRGGEGVYENSILSISFSVELLHKKKFFLNQMEMLKLKITVLKSENFKIHGMG